jgi:hypothetical protein
MKASSTKLLFVTALAGSLTVRRQRDPQRDSLLLFRLEEWSHTGL